MSKHNHHHHHGSHTIAGHGHAHGHHSTTGLSPHHHHFLDTSCAATTVAHSDHVSHSLDLVTTLRSELAAISYKRDRLVTELTETKSALCAKDTECESLRAQTARQAAHIHSLQSRLQAAETRERSLQERCENTIKSLTGEKRCLDEKNKELLSCIRRLEVDVSNEEGNKEQIKAQLHELLRKLCVCLEIDVCDPVHLSPDCVVGKAGEVVAELHRLRNKLASTCDNLTAVENEFGNFKSLAGADKDRLNSQIDALQNNNHELEGRCRQYERDIQLTKDHLSESEICNEKLKEELRGFESRCQRLQNTMDRFQSDRMSFLRTLAGTLNAKEPCETLIKDRLREVLTDNQTTHAKLHNVSDQLTVESERHKEHMESANCRIRAEEAKNCELEKMLEKSNAEIHDLRAEHIRLSDYLVRLARALSWSECTSPPAPGTDTTIMAESLLERAEQLTAHHEHHLCDKNCHHDHHHSHPHPHPHPHHHHHGTSKLRRERSCNDIPMKESSAMYTLQRRVRVLREQVQRRDLHLELLRRKVALLEEGARGKCVLQGERDEAMCRLKKANNKIDKLAAQLVDARNHLADLKGQLSEAVEHKIQSLERARKIDELNTKICDLEGEKSKLFAQLSATKERIRSTVSTSQERRCRDEVLINSLREDIQRFERQLSEANHRISHLQSFRTSVARTLHLRDIPETDLLHRLQMLCNAHQEFTMLSRRYESASPIGDHPCPRFDDPIPPSVQCRPLSSTSPSNHHHYRTSERNSKSKSKYDSKYDSKYESKYDTKYDTKYDSKYDAGAGGGGGGGGGGMGMGMGGCGEGRGGGGAGGGGNDGRHDPNHNFSDDPLDEEFDFLKKY